MAQSQQRLSELTIDEFVALVRSTVHNALNEERQPPTGKYLQAGLLDIPPVSVGEWKPGVKLISREEYYDDER